MFLANPRVLPRPVFSTHCSCYQLYSLRKNTSKYALQSQITKHCILSKCLPPASPFRPGALSLESSPSQPLLAKRFWRDTLTSRRHQGRNWVGGPVHWWTGRGHSAT